MCTCVCYDDEEEEEEKDGRQYFLIKFVHMLETSCLLCFGGCGQCDDELQDPRLIERPLFTPCAPDQLNLPALRCRLMSTARPAFSGPKRCRHASHGGRGLISRPHIALTGSGPSEMSAAIPSTVYERREKELNPSLFAVCLGNNL